MRYTFGKNWQSYLRSSFSDERVAIAQAHLAEYLRQDRLDGLTFIDIGSGSGIHSLAAFRAGAARIVSFDYDADSVAATRWVWEQAGRPANWEIRQGSILDDALPDQLGTFDIVYSWGVLHHTGDQWKALANAGRFLKPDGRLYIALYSSEIYCNPPPQYWLDVKRRYNEAGEASRRVMELGYLWRFVLGRSVGNLVRLPVIARDYRRSRGMNLMVDVRDWLGGWPMEFSSMPEVNAFVAERTGFVPARIGFGEGCTEFVYCAPERLGAFGYLAPVCAVDDLPRQPFFIFGTAEGARLLAEVAMAAGRTVEGFIDIEPREATFLGRPVASVQDFLSGGLLDRPVLMSNRYVYENAARLAPHGATDLRDALPLVKLLAHRALHEAA